MLLHPGQVSGRSGHRLNITHFTDPLDTHEEVKEVNATLPYPTRPRLFQHLQESCGVLIDTRVATSKATSFAPLTPITEHSGHLVNVNGGDIRF